MRSCWRARVDARASAPQTVYSDHFLHSAPIGGCTMAGIEERGVTAPDGRYRGLANLSVDDGSLFPTSIGANPQLSIYGITARLAGALAQTLTGKPAARVAA